MAEEELKRQFAGASADLEVDVLRELQSIMRIHSIDAQELWYKWESYSMKMGVDDFKLSLDTARALKKDVQDTLERENRNKAHVLTSSKRGGVTPRTVTSTGDVFGMYVLSGLDIIYCLLFCADWMALCPTRPSINREIVRTSGNTRHRNRN